MEVMAAPATEIEAAQPEVPAQGRTGRAGGVRARVRAELTAEIKEAARRQLAEVGAADLSLRAVARELGMVSSAMYRYFASRDELLTALIIDAYNALGAEAESADAGVARADLEGRFRAVGRAIRRWGLAHPYEYALIYGSPVPGYVAPDDTIAAASRTSLVLTGILADGHASALGAPGAELPEALRTELERLGTQLGGDVPPPLLARGLTVWMGMFGAVSFELFGQLHNVVDERDALFEFELDRWIGLLELR